MDTVIVSNGQFYSHYPKNIAKGTVDAEAVLIRLDSEWDNLTVRIHWLNVASNAERKPLLERDQPNTIPWEVLTDLGELRMGLVGLDGETVIKPTIWLTYGYVVDGVDPEAGDDPHPPTPSWEQQMVEQAKAAAAAAEASKDAAEKAGEAAGAAAPYADEAKKSAEEAKASQDAATTSAQRANEAAQTAQNAVGSIGDSVQRAEDAATAAGVAYLAAEQAATTAGAAQSGASQSAQAAANSAQAAERAKKEAQNAAAAFPAPSPEVAGMVPVVNPEGNGYIFGEAGGGGELLIAEYVQRGNQEIYFSSFDWASGIGECTKPHGLTEATQAMLVWNDWMTGNVYNNATAMPVEWTSLDQNLFLIPTDDTHVMVVGNDKSTPITVNASDSFNQNIDATKIHFEIPVGFRISDIPELYTKVQLTIFGVIMGNKRYRYIAFVSRKEGGGDVWINTVNLLYPPYFGVLSKPRHGLLTSHNITLELNEEGGGSFLYSNYLCGRRNNYVGFPGEEYTEIKRALQPYNPTSVRGIAAIDVSNSYAVWANGTRFRLYGLCKGGEYN